MVYEFDIPFFHPVPEIASIAINFTNYTDARDVPIDPETFNITNCNEQGCTCPQPKSCPGGPGDYDGNSFSRQVYKRGGVAQPITLAHLMENVPRSTTHPEIRETEGRQEGMTHLGCSLGLTPCNPKNNCN